MPTLYLTEDYAFVRHDSKDFLLVQIPEKRAKDGATPSPARKERVPLIKIDEVVVLGEVTIIAAKTCSLVSGTLGVSIKDVVHLVS